MLRYPPIRTALVAAVTTTLLFAIAAPASAEVTCVRKGDETLVCVGP